LRFTACTSFPETDIAKIDMNLPGVFMGVTRLKEAVAHLNG